MEKRSGNQSGTIINATKTIFPENNLFLTTVSWPSKWNSWKRVEFLDQELLILLAELIKDDFLTFDNIVWI